MSEPDLRRIFEVFGNVQTCIVNKEKRHAFVKMVTRKDAQIAKDGMERNRTPDSQLRVSVPTGIQLCWSSLTFLPQTRWGVGFGPRECSDYQTGVSIIPISKLTDADRKWMATAEYGGSGVKGIYGGMVVEEPDIEIGQGVSSKAISRRMQTDVSGLSGPKSAREREDETRRNEGRHGSQDKHQPQHRGNGRSHGGSAKKERNSNINGPPAMPPIPAFGLGMFPFSLPNGMPLVPPAGFPGFPSTPTQTQNSSKRTSAQGRS